MSKLVVNLEPKKFQALIMGISKSLFFDESATYTQQYFRETLFGNNGDVDVSSIIDFYKNIITKCAENNWDVSQVEESLADLAEEVSSDQKNVFIFFWTNEKDKIHKELVQKSRWNCSIKSTTWRVDLRTTTKLLENVNEPIAFFDISTNSGTNKNDMSSNSNNKTSFEMNRQQVEDMLMNLNTIQRKFDESSM